jgi:hypothetical protein
MEDKISGKCSCLTPLTCAFWVSWSIILSYFRWNHHVTWWAWHSYDKDSTRHYAKEKQSQCMYHFIKYLFHTYMACTDSCLYSCPFDKNLSS